MMRKNDLDDGLAKEIADLLAHGIRQVTIKEMKRAVNELGYTFDRYFDAKGICTNLTGKLAGVRFRGCSLSLRQMDNGISPFHYKDARRDKNFEKLQKFRGTLFAVRNGYIYTF